MYVIKHKKRKFDSRIIEGFHSIFHLGSQVANFAHKRASRFVNGVGSIEASKYSLEARAEGD
jgi:hypothetical protein